MPSAQGGVSPLGARHPNPRLVKIHRSYSLEETARLFSIHKNTVRNWIGLGLATVDHQRPILFRGLDLRDFLAARRRKAKRPCGAGEIYCVACKVPRRPAGEMADYIPATETSGTLKGLCPVCERLIHRRVRQADLGRVSGALLVSVQHEKNT